MIPKPIRTRRSQEEREAMTRAILEAPIEMSHQAIAVKVGLQRETVRKIRYGIVNADLLPELPRLELGALTRSCTDCIHFKRHVIRTRVKGERIGFCQLDFVEGEDLAYARGCAAFWPLPKQKEQSVSA